MHPILPPAAHVPDACRAVARVLSMGRRPAAIGASTQHAASVLRARKDELGLTYATLAERSGMALSTVQRMLAAGTAIDGQALIELCRALDVDAGQCSPERHPAWRPAVR